MQPSPDDARRLLCALGDHVRDLVVGARGMDMAVIEGRTSADTIYAIDRVADDTLRRLVRGALARRSSWCRRASTSRCVIGPRPGVDGDRRHASTAPAASCTTSGRRGASPPRRRAAARLRDVVAAAMTELPTTKQGARRSAQRHARRGRRSRSGSTCATVAAHRSTCGRRPRPTSSTASPAWPSSSRAGQGRAGPARDRAVRPAREPPRVRRRVHLVGWAAPRAHRRARPLRRRPPPARRSRRVRVPSLRRVHRDAARGGRRRGDRPSRRTARRAARHDSRRSRGRDTPTVRWPTASVRSWPSSSMTSHRR